MKHAKWLLLVAVGIALVLPGCKRLDPMASLDVNAAVYTENLAGPMPLWTGGKQPQTQIGTVTMYWQYDYYDENADPEYVNLALVIKAETYSPDYPITDANLNISVEKPEEKGAPGLYNFNSYLLPYPDPYTAIFYIPVEDLMEVPWECGDKLWFKIHIAAGGETAYPGEFVPGKPGKTAWFNRLQVEVTCPDNGNGQISETAWGYDINDPFHYFWQADPKTKWGGVIPFALGTVKVEELWAGAGQNETPPGVDIGSVTVWDGWEGSMHYVYVKYDIDVPGWSLIDVHFGADPTLLDMYTRTKKFAPGLLGNTHTDLGGLLTFEEKMLYKSSWGNNFVVAAHAVVEHPAP